MSAQSPRQRPPEFSVVAQANLWTMKRSTARIVREYLCHAYRYGSGFQQGHNLVMFASTAQRAPSAHDACVSDTTIWSFLSNAHITQANGRSPDLHVCGPVRPILVNAVSKFNCLLQCCLKLEPAARQAHYEALYWTSKVAHASSVRVYHKFARDVHGSSRRGVLTHSKP